MHHSMSRLLPIAVAIAAISLPHRGLAMDQAEAVKLAREYLASEDSEDRGRLTERLAFVNSWGRAEGRLHEGDHMVLVAGAVLGVGAHNTVAVHQV